MHHSAHPKSVFEQLLGKTCEGRAKARMVMKDHVRTKKNKKNKKNQARTSRAIKRGYASQLNSPAWPLLALI